MLVLDVVPLIMMAGWYIFNFGITVKILCGITAACLPEIHVVVLFSHFLGPLIGKSHIDKHATCMHATTTSN